MGGFSLWLRLLCFPLPGADPTGLVAGAQGAAWGSPPECPHLVHPHLAQSLGPSALGGRLGGAGLGGGLDLAWAGWD